MTSYFPDVNVWVAAVSRGHSHHEIAAEWLNSLDSSYAYFSRVTQLGFLRIISNPAAMRTEALDVSAAWRAYLNLSGAAHVRFLVEPDEGAIDEIMSKLIASSLHSHQRWTDAYLVAFARVSGLTFVTFDRACHQLAKPDSILLP